MFDQTPEQGRPDRRAPSINVLGGVLEPCSTRPVTGFYRDGCCNTGAEDIGLHTVCVVLTAEFLVFSRSRGNDLSTPMPQYGFPGLKPGDRWCLCASRWKEAFDANVAPQVVLEATHAVTLHVVSLGDLKQHAFRPH
ncbi:MAG: DUF2237 domain-containing protein [Reyranella sp.]|uniref:DUF2237 family protein n=1 Tax=Reyranella sp. TaxID=1929291 RepID=UPI00121EF4FC|nr:DUF2237 domain-containing protein [Reyranella sp.]TAJ88580.1 MAG: DUF2237 domain-containing protein [Reyranella sp.]TBR29176.1 MAG: DUF2237 domain-containing protein [Reyranella sp.]